jgi:hypothetical protein
MKLADCTKLQKRYLKRFVCFLCEQPLSRDDCAAIYGDWKCTAEIIEQRRADCLTHYRPRTNHKVALKHG